MADELFDEDEVITLTDEDGVQTSFIVLCVLDYKGSTYYALLPQTPVSDEDDGEYVLLKLTRENGEDILVTVDDDDEADDVASQVDEILNSEIDDDEDEDEDEKV